MNVVELSKTEMHPGEGNFAPLEAKVENNFECTRVGNENRQIFASDVRGEAEQEAFLVGGGEANSYIFSDCRAPWAKEIVFNDGIGSQVDADFWEMQNYWKSWQSN